MGRRSRSTLLTIIALTLTVACDEDKVFTTTGTLRVSVVDRSIVIQSTEPPGFQVAVWELERVDLDIQDFGVFDYNPSAECTHLQTRPAQIEAIRCGVGGIAFEPDLPLLVTMKLTISDLELRSADRPALPPVADYDGDSVPNEDDNCVLIPNPGQEDIDGDGFGDACSLPDGAGDPTIPDRDGDGVADAAPDNCLWIQNPPDPITGQPDANEDGIGDACELVTDVSLANCTMPLENMITVTVPDSAVTTISADFDNQMTLPGCNPGDPQCVLDCTAIQFTQP